MRLDDIIPGTPPILGTRCPFSFVCGGEPSDDLLAAWSRDQHSVDIDGSRTRITTMWTDPDTGLRVCWEATGFADFPALDWVLHFENTGSTDTRIIEDIQSLDLALDSPLDSAPPYRLYKTHGGTPDPTQFEPTVVAIDENHSATMGPVGGRSSDRDLPFFRLATGNGSVIVAVGWSGQWRASVECPDGKRLHVKAGLEKTRFLLHPGERVRSPRSLVFHWQGDPLDSNARFRRLIHTHYAARRDDEVPLPPLFCNTAFTRGGGWLNECNAENQISLIHAYAPIGPEALITDAGWFEGGWPSGAGSWIPRKDAYPDGMAPVAAAAKVAGMIYGLWFEPERVVAGTWLHQHHPEWLLSSGDDPQTTYLLDLGLPEVRDHLFELVKGFMDLPGFRAYRQDFNMEPLAYWRHSDPPDRQGITEIKYIEGLYAFWDRIAETWPDSLREECASGGNRIDLETVMRLHIHQKTDYWFDNEVDQAATWGLSQYLPNNVFVTPLTRMDDYSFHSAMASSLCLGWIADAPDFDLERAKRLADRYRQVHHLLTGDWYPLLPYSRGLEHWMAAQYHRADLGEGMILVFRRPESPYPTVEVSLRGLEPATTYELTYDSSGATGRHKGARLMAGCAVTLAQKHQSELITYREVAD